MHGVTIIWQMVYVGLAKKVHLGFSATSFGKTQTHFFANLISGDIYRNMFPLQGQKFI